MNLYDILLFLMWTIAVWGSGYYFGYDNKAREIAAKEIVDSLGVVKDVEPIEHTHFIGEDGKAYEIWITEAKVYSMDADHFPNFKWKDEFAAGTCVPALLIPTTNVSGFYKNRLVK